MGYVPKFIHLCPYKDVRYPFGLLWNYEYIRECAKAIYITYKDEIKEGITIALVGRGLSGAMIAGGIITVLHRINPSIEACILVVRKDSDLAHNGSLDGITLLNNPKFIVVDDFIESGNTIRAILEKLDDYFGHSAPQLKYDMLCISNSIDKDALKKNKCKNYKKWKNICSRFKYVVCYTKPD